MYVRAGRRAVRCGEGQLRVECLARFREVAGKGRAAGCHTVVTLCYRLDSPRITLASEERVRVLASPRIAPPGRRRRRRDATLCSSWNPRSARHEGQGDRDQVERQAVSAPLSESRLKRALTASCPADRSTRPTFTRSRRPNTARMPQRGGSPRAVQTTRSASGSSTPPTPESSTSQP